MSVIERSTTIKPFERAVFVTDDDRRARRLRHSAFAAGLLACLWLVGLGLGMFGFGSAKPLGRSARAPERAGWQRNGARQRLAARSQGRPTLEVRHGAPHHTAGSRTAGAAARKPGSAPAGLGAQRPDRTAGTDEDCAAAADVAGPAPRPDDHVDHNVGPAGPGEEDNINGLA